MTNRKILYYAIKGMHNDIYYKEKELRKINGAIYALKNNKEVKGRYTNYTLSKLQQLRNEFKQDITNVIQKDKEPLQKTIKEPSKAIASIEKKSIQKSNKSISNEKLMELIELVEPIKEMLEDYNRKKNIVDVNTVELRPKAVIEVKQKLFKIDVSVLEQWEEFVLNHKEFKVQQLISLALEEFIQKYN